MVYFRPQSGLGVDTASDRNGYQKYFQGCKGVRCLGLTTLPPSSCDCLEIWEPQPPGIFWSYLTLNGMALPVSTSI
jgi:hypothetical protein